MIFESVIKPNGFGAWLIELTNTQTQESVICNSVEEYMLKVAQMGDAYAEELEVNWSASEEVLPEHINELRAAMLKYQQEQEAEKESAENGFDPNA